LKRVDEPAAVGDAEVQVFAGDPAGSAGNGDGISCSYAVLRPYQDLAEVAIKRFDAPVAQPDSYAQAIAVSYGADHATEHGIDRIAPGPEIDPVMDDPFSGQRVNPIPEAGIDLQVFQRQADQAETDEKFHLEKVLACSSRSVCPIFSRVRSQMAGLSRATSSAS